MRSRFRFLAPLLVLTCVVAACAGAASPTPGPSTVAATPQSSVPSASGASAICSDAADFRASMTALTNLQLASVGASGVTAALTDVQSAAQALAVSGQELVGVPVTNLLASVHALQTTLTGLGNQPSLGAGLVAVKAAIDQIKAAASDVESALGTACPAP